MALESVSELRALLEQSRHELGHDSARYASLIAHLDRIANELDAGRLDEKALTDTLSEISQRYPYLQSNRGVPTVGAATGVLQAAIVEIINHPTTFARLSLEVSREGTTKAP